MPPCIHPEKCARCGLCCAICPMSLFERGQDGLPQVKYPEECWHCNACVLDCPAGAVSLRIPLNYMLLHVKADSLKI